LDFDNEHAKETGQSELETLVNTFLIYAPVQLIAGRQRPGEGNGHGDFLRHHNMNTSFPGAVQPNPASIGGDAEQKFRCIECVFSASV